MKMKQYKNMNNRHFAAALTAAAFASSVSAATLSVGTDGYSGAEDDTDIEFVKGSGTAANGSIGFNGLQFEMSGWFTTVTSNQQTTIMTNNTSSAVFLRGGAGTNIMGGLLHADVESAVLLSDYTFTIGGVDGDTQVYSGADIVLRTFDIDSSDDVGPGNVFVAATEVAIDADITTISGALVISAPQGDILMGEFGR